MPAFTYDGFFHVKDFLFKFLIVFIFFTFIFTFILFYFFAVSFGDLVLTIGCYAV